MKPLAALALLAALLALALLLGDQPLPPAEVAAALVDPASVRPETAFITRELRLPRALLALLLGAGLGVAGAVTQALMRNPLAEPGLLGINGGAALAAILVMVWLPGLSAAWLPWAAFGGALAASGAIWALAWRQGARSGRIILMGIGLGALMGAASSFASAFGEITAVQRAMLWLAGSLQDSRWIKVQTLALWLAAPLALAWAGARALDLLAFDDAVAQGLGLRVQAARGLMILLCALVCGAAVAAAGPIGFVGLIAPHLARAAVGPGHARVIPLAALAGAALLLAADTAGRTLIASAQIPAGIMCALLGAPFFGWLMWNRRDE